MGGLKDADWWLDKMRQAQELGMLFPLLTGGEPLLHPDFRKIYEGLINMGMQISVNSTDRAFLILCSFFITAAPPSYA